MIPMFAAAAFLFLFLAWNWLLYSFQFEEKVEQYDEHIALYVNNTFARTRFRYPHYMYEENCHGRSRRTGYKGNSGLFCFV